MSEIMEDVLSKKEGTWTTLEQIENINGESKSELEDCSIDYCSGKVQWFITLSKLTKLKTLCVASVPIPTLDWLDATENGFLSLEKLTFDHVPLLDTKALSRVFLPNLRELIFLPYGIKDLSGIKTNLAGFPLLREICIFEWIDSNVRDIIIAIENGALPKIENVILQNGRYRNYDKALLIKLKQHVNLVVREKGKDISI